MQTPILLTDENLDAARAVAAAHGCTLKRLRPDAVLVSAAETGGDVVAVFERLEETGYDVSHLVTSK